MQKKNGKILGVLLLNQLQTKQGWLLSHLMITKEAPHGTPELLVTTAVEVISKEDRHFVTFGSMPRKQLDEMIGLNKISIWFIKKIFKIATNLTGRKKFWKKFQPQCKPSYLLFSHSHVRLKEILSLMRALNVTL